MITARSIPGSHQAPKSVQSKMDTLIVTPEVVSAWVRPAFQRDLRKTVKYDEVVAVIKATREIPGVLTLGTVAGGGDAAYLVDGQHRTAAFVDSEVPEALVDVRICRFGSMAEMAEEFRTLNGKIAAMKTDDLLRAREAGGDENLKLLRRRCPFIGYGNIKHVQAKATATAKTVLSVATAVRLWSGSQHDTPVADQTEHGLAYLDQQTTLQLVSCLEALYEAWGGDKSNLHLYNSLTVAIVMWMWRRTVLAPAVSKNGGAEKVRLTHEQFVRCLMELSADKGYADWSVGRVLRDRDRSPAYNKIRAAFARRLVATGIKSPRFPAADWMRL